MTLSLAMPQHQYKCFLLYPILSHFFSTFAFSHRLDPIQRCLSFCLPKLFSLSRDACPICDHVTPIYHVLSLFLNFICLSS
ncbi:hypothetical protein VIGAN_10154800 [Vigna angularis var. angularis]|uniref:Uncharacterized protein n=1 Tax=Vigna angularis var. angularis TaxID=157739 RepID=A0A0S3T4D7_PHAAN|nr:hypothetical protein VIGAN_10154800 [Vigna angularis var. angularis]